MDTVSAYVDRYYAALTALDNAGKHAQRERAEFARGQATAYLWGRIDGGDRFDPVASDAFPWAFGTVQALFELGRITSMGAIRESWECFLKFGEIRDYNRRALDRVSPERKVTSNG